MMPAMLSTRYFDPLRHRDFALLWSGQAVSQLGDGVFTVTLALEALRVDRHAAGCLTCWLLVSCQPSCPLCWAGDR